MQTLNYPENTIWYIEARSENNIGTEEYNSCGSAVAIWLKEMEINQPGKRYLLTCAHVIVNNETKNFFPEIRAWQPGKGYGCRNAGFKVIPLLSPFMGTEKVQIEDLQYSPANDWVVLEFEEEKDNSTHDQKILNSNPKARLDRNTVSELADIVAGAPSIQKLSSSSKILNFGFVRYLIRHFLSLFGYSISHEIIGYPGGERIWTPRSVVLPKRERGFIFLNEDNGIIEANGISANNGMSGGGVFSSWGEFLGIHRSSIGIAGTVRSVSSLHIQQQLGAVGIEVYEPGELPLVIKFKRKLFRASVILALFSLLFVGIWWYLTFPNKVSLGRLHEIGERYCDPEVMNKLYSANSPLIRRSYLLEIKNAEIIDNKPSFGYVIKNPQITVELEALSERLKNSATDSKFTDNELKHIQLYVQRKIKLEQDETKKLKLRDDNYNDVKRVQRIVDRMSRIDVLVENNGNSKYEVGSLVDVKGVIAGFSSDLFTIENAEIVQTKKNDVDLK